MSNRIRWGILGTGMIAGIFTRALPRARTAIAHAVASRSAERAGAFAREHGIPRAHGSAQALFDDPEIDAIYIATPHPNHHAETLAALRAGKHVLVEKPMAVTAVQALEMAAAATAAKRVLLEAFMYRLHPQTRRLQQVLAAGAIGRLRVIRSCFTFGLGDHPNVRLDAALHGGALWDVGCYCVNASRMLSGEEPVQTSAVAWIEPASGVDAHTAVAMRFPSGVVAHFDVGIRSAGSNSVELLGDRGRIVVPAPWKPDATRSLFSIENASGLREEVIEDGGDIYALEADHLAAVIAGAPTPISAESGIANTRVLEGIWRQIRP